MSLTKTEHLGLNVFQQTQETTTLVRDVLRAIADDSIDSNMRILDQVIFGLQSNIVWNEIQPASQNDGDIWNEILHDV